MTIAEARELKKGTPVKWSLGQGWTQYGEFLGLIEVTKFGTMTLSDLMRGNINMDGGKKVIEAEVEFEDDRGRTKTDYISLRKLRRA